VYWLDSRRYFPDGHAGLLSERELMHQIFQACTPNSLHLGWMIDEFSGVALLSHFALAVLASDYFNNLEVWTAIKPALAVPDHPPLQAEPLPAPVLSHESDARTSKGGISVSFTLSDGDNIQYCQHKLLELWNGPVRGTIPLGWTLSPLLLQAAPAMGAYYQQTATANDELLAGPSGAGYMYPTHWPRAHLPKFLQQTGELMSGMGMKILEVLDGDHIFGSGLPFIPKVSVSGMTLRNRRLQRQFSCTLAPYGMQSMISGNGYFIPWDRWPYVEKIPVCHNIGLVESVKTTVLFIRVAAKIYRQRPLFLNVYVNAWFMGPAQIQQAMQELGDEYTFVLPGTLLATLAKTF
jgi:GxGYxYP putative glycoside hydrolase C-terminal domain/GxGYxYP third domain